MNPFYIFARAFVALSAVIGVSQGPMSDSNEQHVPLKRQVGLWGAVFMGLGAMIGTGVFVSIGIAAGLAGPAVILAVALAAVVAACNGLSSAQLAAAHPVSGGTYEYGYKYLTPQLGFTAGWMFLIAKSASAATAALGAGWYVADLARRLNWSWQPGIGLAISIVVALTWIVLLGISRSNTVNICIVAITLTALGTFVVIGIPVVADHWQTRLTPFFSGGWQGTLHATALMFVAYTGYGRIATLGEEVKAPEKTIPRAIVATMIVTAILYGCVATIVAMAIEPEDWGRAGGLSMFAPIGGMSGYVILMVIGAFTAMLGVLLNLILGLSRVLLAMGRRGDMPSVFSRVSQVNHSPQWSVIGVSAIILAFTLIGDIKLAWSFSAFTVLIYYSITNLAALRMPPEERRYPRWVSQLGLAACLFLAFQVDARTWQIGLGLIALGLGWHTVARGRRLAETGHAD